MVRGCKCKQSLLIVSVVEQRLLNLRHLLSSIFKVNVLTATDSMMAKRLFIDQLFLQCGCKNRTFQLIIFDLQGTGIEAPKQILEMIGLAKEHGETISCNIVALHSSANAQLL